MSTRETITRQHLIIQKVRKFPASFSEICDYLKEQSEIQGYNFNVSRRTFERDLADIRFLYGIDIRLNRTDKVYYITHEEEHDIHQRMLESFDIFNALNLYETISDYIHLEKYPPRRTENINGLLHAIKNKLQISFLYHKFEEKEPSERTVEPYALKEFKNRWYIVAKDLKDNKIKNFSLDRLIAMEIKKKHFQWPENFNVKEHFKHYFGIIHLGQKEPSEIILSFSPSQGKYIKTLPLHESQTILKDNEEELRIRLNLVITYDFLMEILSFGQEVKVIQPNDLIREIKKNYQNALKQYDHD